MDSVRKSYLSKDWGGVASHIHTWERVTHAEAMDGAKSTRHILACFQSMKEAWVSIPEKDGVNGEW